MSAATAHAYRWGDIAPALEAAVSYRQVDNWCRTGAITLEHGSQAHGSGTRRLFTPDDVDRLVLISLLPDVATGGGPHGYAVPSIWVSAVWYGLTPTWLDHIRAGMLSAYQLRLVAPGRWVLVHPTRQHPFSPTDPMLRIGIPSGLIPADITTETP